MKRKTPYGLRLLAEEKPCWDGYEMVGTKQKDGKTVPNCVPQGSIKSSKKKRRKKLLSETPETTSTDLPTIANRVQSKKKQEEMLLQALVHELEGHL